MATESMENDELDVPHEKMWTTEKFTPEDNKHSLLCETNYKTLFPRYREKYLEQHWEVVQKALGEVNIKAELDLVGSVMSVSTTRKTWDPYAIIKAKDFIKLLSRSVPFEQAVRIIQEDDIGSYVVKIKSFVRNKERFVKRRKRLIGPNGTTLKAIELLTNCYMLVQGNTVSLIGPYAGIKDATKIIEDCMKNIHPVYNLKTLMVKKELMQRPELKNESWDKYLPKYQSKNVSKRKKPMKKKEKKKYTPFPPPMPESKVDKELTTGEYFLQEKEKHQKKMLEKKEKQQEAVAKKKAKRAKAFIPPEEPKKKRKQDQDINVPVDIESLKKKVKKSQKTTIAKLKAEEKPVEPPKKKKKLK